MLSSSRPPRFRPALLALGLTLGGALSHPALAQVAVLTQNNDNARTGSNTAETALTPANVNVSQFGKLFTIQGLDANVNGQVLYVPGVTIGGVKHNALYAYQSNNADGSPCALAAFDADNGALLWRTPLPTSATYSTATPVIDPTTSTIYVLNKTSNDDTGVTYLHAFDITTGKDKPGSPIQVQATVSGTGDGSVNGKVSFDGPASSGRFHANDRAGLLLLNGTVYLGFAHNSDSYPYHGWLLSYKYDGTQFTQTGVFCTTPNGGEGGIWMSGKGLTVDSDGNIYFSVGNGTFDANSGGPDYGMCYMKLSPSLQVLDWFAPYDEQSQSNQDLDDGNSGVVGIPGTASLFGGATKFGAGFLMDSMNLGHFNPSPSTGFDGVNNVVQRFDHITGNDSVGQNPIAWNAGSGVSYVYLWARGANLEQFAVNQSTGKITPAAIFKQVSRTDGGSLGVSSNGTGSGILWAIGGDNKVHAFNANDVSQPELWDSGQNSARDGLGSVGHFQFPTVVNGKVYAPTGSSSIAVYGLLPKAPPVSTGIALDSGGGTAGSFVADTDYTGGSTYATGTKIDTSAVTSPAPQAVYQSERYGNFTYVIPNLTPGAPFIVRLHFAEIYWNSVGQRVFNVGINGTPALSNFDIYKTAGGANKAVIEQFNANADKNGKITIVYTTVKDNAKSSGIEVLPANTVNDGGGFTGAGLTLNGSAKLSGSSLELTDGGGNEAGSAFTSAPVSVQSFHSTFSFQIVNPNADGLTFTIQGVGATALGAPGGALGYGGIGKSAAVKFDIYNNAGEGTDSTGLFTNGASPFTPSTDLTGSGIDLHSGHVFTVSLGYDGTTLTATEKDATTGASKSQSYPVNLPALVGGNTAYVGFTGGTGGLTATQNVLNWTFGS